MKCTYRHCVEPTSAVAFETAGGLIAAGTVDEKMRPWHHECAKRALGQYPSRDFTFFDAILAALIITTLLTQLKC